MMMASKLFSVVCAVIELNVLVRVSATSVLTQVCGGGFNGNTSKRHLD
jgi:hypothetical protein